MAQQQTAVVEHGREPCPHRILDDIGGAFGMGAIGGGAWNMYRGLRNSPRGYKLRGTVEMIRREAPRLGGSFANWGLMFSFFDCTCSWVRKKEDPFNAIAAGFLTGGFLQLRSGLKPAFRSAVFGGVLLAAIEGLGITLQKMASPPPPGVPTPPGMDGMQPGMAGMAPAPAPPPDIAAADGGGGWASWFGFGGEQQPPQSSSVPHEFTEEFTPPPIPKDLQPESFSTGK